jgi:alpha-1,3-fucosyltransferase 10
VSPPLVLVWCDPWFDVDEAAALVAGHCELTLDRGRFEGADAVIFPVPTMVRPGNTPPAARAFPEQSWVIWSQESSVQFPQLDDPAFVRRFDLTMTYRFDSDVPIPYLSDGMFDRLPPLVPPGRRRKAPVAAFVSSRSDKSGRSEYLTALMQQVPVDSYGQVCHTADLVDDRGRSTKLEVMAAYRFTFAFENSIAEDYVTEKFFDPLLVGSVPVYRGAPNVVDFAPGDRCYVDAAAFAGPQELARFLAAMTDEEYHQYHEWRRLQLRAEFTERCSRVKDHALVRLARVVPVIRLGRRAAIRHRGEARRASGP